MSNISWRATGEGLALQTAREVARSHGVPLEVVLKGHHVLPGVHACLDTVEDHVLVETDDAGDHVKFHDYGLFTAVFRPLTPRPDGKLVCHPAGTLTVVIMPYADLASCKKIDELARAATPQLETHLKIEIANRGLLIHKLRATAAVADEAHSVRDLGAQIESLGQRGLFAAKNKYPRSWALGRADRRIAMERLMKAHLDARQYGDAHDLLLLLDRGKHDAVFKGSDPCRHPPACLAENEKAVAGRLEEYKQELEGKIGSTAPLHPWPERADVLGMEARRVFHRQLVDARRQVIDVVEAAVQELESIAEQLLTAGTQPSLLGFGV